MAVPPLILVDRDDRARLELAGPDRRDFLQRLVSNDVARRKPFEGCEALLLTPKGRLVAPLVILELGERTWIDLPGEIGPEIAKKLSMYILRQAVTLADRTGDGRTISIAGEGAAEAVAATGAEPPGPDRLAGRETTVAGAPAIVVRTDEYGRPGFDLHLPADAAAAARAALVAAGAAPIDAETAEALRIAAGEPRWGREMTPELLPPEIPALVPRAISYTKGCYVGQETIARIRTYGHVNRELRRLVVEAAEPPAPGTELFAGGQPAGRITSAARHPETGRPIALAFIRRPHLEAPEFEVGGDPAARARIDVGTE